MKETTSIRFMPDRYKRIFTGKTGKFLEPILIGEIDINLCYIIQLKGHAEKDGVFYTLPNNSIIGLYVEKINDNKTGIYIRSNTITKDSFNVTAIVFYKKGESK